LAPDELKELANWALTQPATIRDSILEDGILDLLLARSEGETPITDFSKAKEVTDQVLRSGWLNMTDAVVASGIVSRIAMKLHIVKKGCVVPEDHKLAKALRKVHLDTKKEYVPVTVLSGSRDHKILTVRIPCIGEGPHKEGHENNLAVLLRFAAKSLNLSIDQIRIIPDKELGIHCTMSAKLAVLIEQLSESTNSTEGYFNGEVHEFKSGFKGNLVHILTGIYLLKKFEDHVCRPVRVLQSDKEIKTTTSNELMEVFNASTSLKKDKAEVYSASLMRSIVSLITRGSNEVFPGRWIAATKEINKVKSNEAVLACLGWDLILPSQNKLKSVLLTDCFRRDDRFVVRPINETNYPEGTPWAVTRTAVYFSLPFIDTLSNVGLEEQMRHKDLSPMTDSTLRYFKMRHRTTASLNKSYGVLSSLRGDKTKAKPQFYEALRNKMIAETANIEFQDKEGRIFSDFKSLPDNVKGYFKKHYLFKPRDKRPRDEQKPEEPKATTSTVVEVEKTPAPSEKKEGKKRKVELAREPPTIKDVEIRPMISKKPKTQKPQAEVEPKRFAKVKTKKGKEKEIPPISDDILTVYQLRDPKGSSAGKNLNRNMEFLREKGVPTGILSRVYELAWTQGDSRLDSAWEVFYKAGYFTKVDGKVVLSTLGKKNGWVSDAVVLPPVPETEPVGNLEAAGYRPEEDFAMEA